MDVSGVLDLLRILRVPEQYSPLCHASRQWHRCSWGWRKEFRFLNAKYFVS